MTQLAIGDKAPDFSMPATGGQTVSAKSLQGAPYVLYFYPKDDTPGCTTEACDFRDNIKQFEKLGAAIVGVSKDSVASHEKFAKKFDLNFPLASDSDGVVCAAFGVWVEKSMYGKKYMGIDRSTFLVDAQGRIAGIWRKVKVSEHVAEVTEALQLLAKKAA
ncbi:MAG: thioredoxin-dependent thiol peroxidase [Proteobacteria bacterium]|nr:thioredoxin-dependent thiol peroxidase [Pseudomonadota bacterium]